MKDEKKTKAHLIKELQQLRREASRSHPRSPNADENVDDPRIFLHFAEASSQGMGIASLDGQIHYVNPALAGLVGEDGPEQCIGQSFLNYYNEEQQVKITSQVIPAVLERGCWSGELAIGSNGNDSTPTRENYFLIRDNAGAPLYLAAIISELTDRKVLEDLLIKERDMADRLLQVAPSAIYTVDTDQRITSWNNGAEQLTGYAREEIIGQSCHTFAISPCSDRCGLFGDSITKPIKNRICHIKRKDRKERYIEKNSDLLRNHDGEIIGGIESFTDITDRMHAEHIKAAQLRLINYASELTVSDLLQKFLDEAEILTGSTIGFFHFFDANQEDILLEAWSTNTLKTLCSIDKANSHYPISKAGVWVDCVFKREPVVHNDYENLSHKKGLPPGHAPVTRMLTVPVMRDDEIVAILGVGNKESEYDEKDVTTVQELADFAWESVSRKKTEEALQRSEERLRHAMQAAKVGTWRLDAETRIGIRDASFNRILGLDAVLTKQHINDYINRVHPDDRYKIPRAMNSLLEGEKSYQDEVRILRPDGTILWIFQRGMATYDDSGKLTHITGAAVDITERKQMEEALKENAEHLNLALTSAHIGVWEWDVQQNTMIWSPETEDIFGIEAGSFPGSFDDYLNFIPKEILDDFNVEVDNFLSSEDKLYVDGFEHPIIRGDGQVAWIEARGSITRDGHGKPIRMIGVFADITVSKKAEATLLKEQQRFQDIAESMSDWIWETDAEGNFSYCSEKTETILGYSSQEMLGKSRFEFLIPDNRDLVQKTVEDATNRREPFRRIEGWYLRKDGERVYLSTSGKPVFDNEGTFTGYRGVDADITLRRQTLEELEWHKNNLEELVDNRTTALRESQARFQRLFDSSVIGVLVANLDGEILEANTTFLSMLGYTKEDLPLSWRDITPEAWSSKDDDEVEKLLSQGEALPWEKEFYAKDGALVPVLIGVAMLDGSKDECIAFVLDQHNRKEAEAALQLSEERFALAMQGANDGLWDWNLLTDEVYFSPRWKEMLGYREDELKNEFSTWENLVHPDDLEPARQYIKEYLSGTYEKYETIFRMRQNNGSYANILSRGYAIRSADDGSPIRLIGTHVDISERIQAERKLQHLTQELQRKNKELEQVVYVASHDLRSPLVNVQGFGKELALSMQEVQDLLATMDCPPQLKKEINGIIDEDVPQSLHFINAGIAKMDNLLKGLLRISRLGRAALMVETLDMHALLTNVVEASKYQIDELNAAVNITTLPACSADAEQLNQVFSNLIGNALKFHHPDRAPVITISGHSTDSECVYCVEDNGVGIAAQHQDRVFELYHRLNPTSTEGEGLGLTIVRTIIDRHQGRIWIESEEGVGTKFYIAFPS